MHLVRVLKPCDLIIGGGFVNQEFDAYLSKHGIQHQKLFLTHLNKMVLLKGKIEL